jgi:large subunit ribosomal protein L7/L12
LTSLAEKDNKPAEEENQNGEENPEKEREKKEDVSSAETPPGDETTKTAENTEAASKGSDADVAAAEEEAADSGATDDGDDFDPTKVTYAFTEPPPLSEASQQKIDAIFKKILWLDMIEVHLLTQVVNENLGISWKETEQGMRGGGVGGASKAGAADGAAAEEPAAAKTIFDLKLVGFDAKAKIKVIKEVRTIAGLGLKEAKELVESAPKVIQKDLKQDKAEELKAQLEAVGAEVELA